MINVTDKVLMLKGDMRVGTLYTGIEVGGVLGEDERINRSEGAELSWSVVFLDQIRDGLRMKNGPGLLTQTGPPTPPPSNTPPPTQPTPHFM